MGVVAPVALGPISIPSSYLRPQVLFLALILLKILMLKCPKPKNLSYKFVSDTFLAIQTIKLICWTHQNLLEMSQDYGIQGDQVIKVTNNSGPN
jgi:hypothetical protein